MIRPTDLYLADLMNQAADHMLVLLTVAPCGQRDESTKVVNDLRSAAKATREQANLEQRFRQADGQGSFSDER